MASNPITSWQIDGKTMETVTDFILLGCKITADGDCSHKIKRRLLLGRKAKTVLDSVLKSRDITLPTQVHIVRAMVFPVVMYGYEGWTIMKAECWRIDAFELWCWRRLLRVPWTARRSNQSVLKGRSVQSISRVRLLATPWTAARQASLSITDSRSLLRLISIESVIPSNHLILCRHIPPAFSLSQRQGLFKCVSSLHQVAKVLEFKLQN